MKKYLEREGSFGRGGSLADVQVIILHVICLRHTPLWAISGDSQLKRYLVSSSDVVQLGDCCAGY